MKTRVISAAVLLPLLAIVVLWAPTMYAAVILAILMAIGSYELLYRTGLLRHSRMVIYSSVMAFAVVMWSYAGAVHAYLLLGLIAYSVLLFGEMMADHIHVRIEMVCLCYLAGVIIPYMEGGLIRILTQTIGRHMILVPFCVAFMSDAGAYFVGLKFGRHKLAPVVSPNKTIEGALGGMAAAVVCMLVYAIVLDLLFPQYQVKYGAALLYGFGGSFCGMIGDLCFSIIKRQTGIKDYGNLIPGHGGVLDRMDSMVMVAPLVEALMLLMPLVV